MKKTLTFFICMFFLGHAKGSSHDLFLYGEIGGANGNFSSLKAGVSGIYKKVAFGASYYSVWKNATNVPSDYNAGLVILGSGKPQEYVNMACFSAGMVLYPGSDYFRFVFKGGLAFGNYTYPSDYTTLPKTWFNSNYEVTYTTKTALGLYINPSAEFDIGAGFGLSAGAYAIINTGRSAFGIEGNLLFGRLRKRLGR